MNDEQLDKVAKAALAVDVGGPSQRVWERVTRETKRSWLPSGREMTIAWAASAAVLGALFVSRSPAPNAAVTSPSIAAAEESGYTVAAVSQVAGITEGP